MVFATGNSGKLREASEILGRGFELVTPAQMGILEDIPETGTTLRANSQQKADFIWQNCHTDCFADDTGLEVDALGGAPGVHTARYAGEDKDFNKNMDKLLGELSRKEMEASAAANVSARRFPTLRQVRLQISDIPLSEILTRRTARIRGKISTPLYGWKATTYIGAESSSINLSALCPKNTVILI